MIFNLRQVKCNDDKAKTRLLDYLVKITGYKNFDESMPVVVYVDNDGDIIGFESTKYRIQWVNNAHKLYEIANTKSCVDPVPFSEFKDHVLCMCADLPF